MVVNIVVATLALIISPAASFEVKRPAPKLIVPEGKACAIAFDLTDGIDAATGTMEGRQVNVLVPVRYKCRAGWRIAEVSIALELFDPATGAKTALSSFCRSYDATQDAGNTQEVGFGVSALPDGPSLSCRVSIRAVKGEGDDAVAELCEVCAPVVFK